MTPRLRPRSLRAPWPGSAAENRCWSLSPEDTWPWRSGCAAGRREAYPRFQDRRVAGGPSAHPDRLGWPPPRRDPARPRPPGCGAQNLPADAGDQRTARPADRSGALDAMGEAERVAPGAEVTSLRNPVPAQWARLAAGAGRRRGGRPLDAAARPRRRSPADLPTGAGVSGAGPGAARARPPRPGAYIAERNGGGGGSPGPDRQRHRDAGAARARRQRRGGRRGRRLGRGCSRSPARKVMCG